MLKTLYFHRKLRRLSRDLIMGHTLRSQFILCGEA